jgi:alkylhydroperoxidase/carboxymuconolactone decarboxylase family protein YurZ
MIADAITELMAENGALNIPDLTNLLQNGITSEDVSKIIALSKSFANNTPLNIPDNIDSKDAVKAALRLAFNGDLDQFAKTVLAQKAMAVSGATPEQVAKVVFLTKSMAENGMSVSEIANALTMAMSMPDGPSKSQIQLLEQLIHEALNDGKGLNEADITMLLSLSDAMNNIEGSMPPEVVRLFKKAMKQRRGSVDNVADTLMSSLTASGESRENVAKAMIRALKATGASPEEIAKTMQQAMEKAGATPEEMARVMAQAMVESGASRK